MIEVRNLRFQYPGSHSSFALRGVSFFLEIGECVALMGANGSGKTTFVRCLNGLIDPIDGEIVVDGLSIKDKSVLFEIRRRVGMVFQHPDSQIVATTVVRELAFGLENLGLAVPEMVERVEEAMERFHLKSLANMPPHLLSGGERQRLALASIWVMRPSYLILDEPTSLLDPPGRDEVLRFLEGNTVVSRMGILLVTQFPDEALMFDRLVVMDKGQIVFNDSPDRVFQNIEALHRMGVGVPVEYELDAYLRD